jgi:hypothetical protein
VRVARCALPWLAVVYLVLIITRSAQGEEQTKSLVAVGTIVCGDREAADDALAAVKDPDAQVVRRLILILRSGGCSDRLAGEQYDVVELEPSGIIRARLRTYLPVYLLTLMATPVDATAPSTAPGAVSSDREEGNMPP